MYQTTRIAPAAIEGWSRAGSNNYYKMLSAVALRPEQSSVERDFSTALVTGRDRGYFLGLQCIMSLTLEKRNILAPSLLLFPDSLLVDGDGDCVIIKLRERALTLFSFSFDITRIPVVNLRLEIQTEDSKF